MLNGVKRFINQHNAVELCLLFCWFVLAIRFSLHPRFSDQMEGRMFTLRGVEASD